MIIMGSSVVKGTWFYYHLCLHLAKPLRQFSTILKMMDVVVRTRKYSSSFNYYKGEYMTIGNPAFCLALYLTDIHFRGKLQHLGRWVGKKSSVDQSELKIQVVSDCKNNYMLPACSVSLCEISHNKTPLLSSFQLNFNFCVQLFAFFLSRILITRISHSHKHSV